MKRNDGRSSEKATAPPPLEEVDIDEVDAANGGFIDMLLPLLMGGGGFMGGGFPGMGGGFPGMGGFPGFGTGGMPQMPMMPQQNNGDILKGLAALLDLSDRRNGNSRGRR